LIDGRRIPVKALPRGDFAWVPESHSMGSTVYDGDNRDISLDCRMWGPLKEDALFGKVIFALPTVPVKNKD